jgi:hypothetical protein
LLRASGENDFSERKKGKSAVRGEGEEREEEGEEEEEEEEEEEGTWVAHKFRSLGFLLRLEDLNAVLDYDDSDNNDEPR